MDRRQVKDIISQLGSHLRYEVQREMYQLDSHGPEGVEANAAARLRSIWRRHPVSAAEVRVPCCCIWDRVGYAYGRNLCQPWLQ